MTHHETLAAKAQAAGVDQPDAYRIVQSGTVVARSEGEHALREIMHYAAVYRQDGPLSIQRRQKRHWRGWGEMGDNPAQP